MAERRYRGRHRAGPSRGARLARRAAVVATVAGLVLAVSAFAMQTLRSPGQLDQRFVDTVRSQGHAVDGGEGEAALVRAARKVCDARRTHGDDRAQRAAVLTHPEVEVVRHAFVDDPQGFLALAFRTYCPLER